MIRRLMIDGLTIRLPNGWQGDPTLLARQVADEIQRQAGNVQAAEQIDIHLQGTFAGSARQLAEQFGKQVRDTGHRSGANADAVSGSRRRRS